MFKEILEISINIFELFSTFVRIRINSSGMNDKITLSLHDLTLKERIKKYASDRGLTVSGIVEDYFKMLIRSQEKVANKGFDLPEDLNDLLEGIYLKDEVKNKAYKELRNKMYNDKVNN